MVSFSGKGVIWVVLILWTAVWTATASAQMFAPPTSSTSPANKPSSQIKVDAKGQKTLVIDEKSAPPQRFAPQGNENPTTNNGNQDPKTMATEGNKKLPPKVAPAQIKVDSQGRKMLISREDGVGMSEPTPDTSYQHTIVNSEKPTTPYWEVAPKANDQPYYLSTATVDTAPYWQVDNESTKGEPYWNNVAEESSSRPYWAPPLQPRDAPDEPVAEITILPHTPKGYETISYYMHEDENGVRHITNNPQDERYNLFSFQVKVEVNIQRGLAGVSSRFTHHTLRPIIMKAARIYNLDPALIAGVIRSESAFDANAVSWAGAQGLMQLMPGTAKDMGVNNPFDPEDNVMGGSRYLRKMLDIFKGDLTLALAAYNSGPGRVARLGRVPNIPETKNYVIIVQRNYDRYKGQF